MGKRRRNRSTGLILLLAGLFFLALNLGWIPGGVGPYLVLIIGLGFLALHLVSREKWPVFPGSFMTMIGIVVALTATNTVPGDLAWPGFVIGPGLAFFLIAALVAEHREWAYIPGGIITFIGLVLMAINLGPKVPDWLPQLIFPLALIAVGVYYLLFRR